MAEFCHIALQYYGLDWLTMIFGLQGIFLLSHHNRLGFICNALSCVCSLAVALLAHQMGFMIYNAIFMAMTVRGFVVWHKPQIA